jgi:WD40 repeat protein
MRNPLTLFAAAALAVAGFSPVAPAQREAPLPPPNRAPHLVLAHAGPHARVTALAFAPDGATLFVGGFDKQLRRYRLAGGKWAAADPIRLPVGPGNAGAVNAVAVSPDGKWVAAAGRAPMREENWTGGEDGIGVDSRRLPPLMKRDFGVVYLLDPANPNGGKVLRGLQSEVRALAFASPAPARGPALVAAGVEWDARGKLSGTVRVFDAATGDEVASRADLPATVTPPGLAAWPTGANGLRVAVAWDSGDAKAGKLLLWDDPGGKAEKSDPLAVAPFNSPLATRVGKNGVAELICGGFDPARRAGVLALRDPSGAAKKVVPLEAGAGELVVPLAVAALPVKGVGDCTAVLSRVRVPEGKGAKWRRELRLLTPAGSQAVTPEGMSEGDWPVLAASPDGRFLAVGGFADNRVAVYDAAALAAGRPVAEELAGAAPGFAKVAFLAGEKLWLGRAADTLEEGGAVLDLGAKARTAAPRAGKGALKPDAPAGAAEPTILGPDAAKKLPARVVVAAGGAERTVSLPAGERVTAAALLPGKPAWDAALGPVLAVARLNERSRSVLVTLYDPTTGKRLIELGGPALPVRSLAFCGSRPLLAAAGDDGTVAVWSLKGVARRLPGVEGLIVTARGGEVVVSAVEANGPADGKLKADDVIESVADPKGVQKPVKTPLEFLLAVRALKPGDSAQVKVKGKPAVAVAVGVAVGFRHPLVTLWVDPAAKGGKHDWVGWTAAGPYDASGEAAESRVGWLTATGDPARPVSFAPAAQYRKLYYKRDFIRALIETADFSAALRQLPQPKRPTLTAALSGGAEERGGKFVTREGVAGVNVAVSDPDDALDPARAELRWRVAGPGGAPAWAREPLAAGRARLDLGNHTWKRGEHRVQIRLVQAPEGGGAPAVLDELTVVVTFIPPRPVLAVKIDGKPVKSGDEITTEAAEVEVTAGAEAKGNPGGAAVAVGAAGAKPAELRRNADGTFAPLKVKLREKEATAILVTATNAGGSREDESDAVELRVRRLPPKQVAPPSLKLEVLTPSDFRAAPDEPFVVRAPKVRLRATVRSAQPLTSFEWAVGDGKPEAGKAGKPDARTNSQEREFDLAADRPLAVRVRAQSANSPVASAAVRVTFEPLPEVSLAAPAAEVASPDLTVSGALAAPGKRPFALRVVVTSRGTGRSREFDAAADPARGRWQAGVALFPGENLLGYVVSYDGGRQELRREGLFPVRYARRPVIAGAAPVDAGAGATGNLALAVLSGDPPGELWVGGERVGFRPPSRPLRLFGAPVWVLRAGGVPVAPRGERLKQLAVAVRTAEGESRRVGVAVLGAPPKPAPPPLIQLGYSGGSVSAGQPLGPVGEQAFRFALKLTSESRLARLEVWHAAGGDATGEVVGGLNPAAAAAAAGGGFELTAAPALRLRPGVNRVRVVAANAGGESSVAFTVSYTPPPVRVVIDSIREPGGAPIPVAPGPAGDLRVGKGVVEVEGRVVWDFDGEPVGRDPHLAAVFVADGVAHLPVRVAPARGGKERKFSGRVYLNARGGTDSRGPGATRVSVELRAGGRPVARQAADGGAVTVTSREPLRKQRLHVVMLGVGVPEAQRRELVRNVVLALGGELPGGNPHFTEGRFARKGFDFAYLYSPRLGYTKPGDLNALLLAVRADIEQRTMRPGDEWVNDVVVLYYHGADWFEKDGRWLGHSATTLAGSAGANLAAHAIRMDGLPEVPGLLLRVVNVVSPDAPAGERLGDGSFLRFAWPKAGERASLLPRMADAIRSERRVGEISGRLAELLLDLPPDGRPARQAQLSDAVQARLFGWPKP